MKISIPAVLCMATISIALLSCNWFKTKKQAEENPLTGEWKLDSLHVGGDSSFINGLLFSEVHDSAGIHLRFTKDSLFSTSETGSDTTVYRYDEKEKQLTIKDSTDYNLSFSRINDSTVALTAKDSTVFFLKKQ